MGHPSKMEILESPQGGSTERGRSLKTAFSHEASLKNCSRKPAFFLYLIFFEILKAELSLTRELYFCCFQNCLGRLFLVHKIYKFAILPAWEPCFREVNVQKTKHLFFLDFLKILVFPMFFLMFWASRRGPRAPLRRPWRPQMPCVSQAPSKWTLGAPPGAPGHPNFIDF